MENGLLHLHNFLRWVILILLFLSIYKAYTGWKNKKIFSDGDRRTWLFLLIASHITLLIGLYQWLLKPGFGMLRVTLAPGASIMKDKFLRFYWVEHPTFMILAVIMITLGYGMAKKPIPDIVKYRRALWLFIVALLFILVAIPWPFRQIIGRPWFPGM
jgi:glucan phosphoethanolaminetransferase (alkaline phosphatase superfamily)